MRAAVTRIGGVVVEEVEEPVPGPGQVLVRTLACGICGSDLHAAADMRRFAGLVAQAGGLGGMDPERGVVFGHEFCAEVVEHGPGTERTFAAGTRVCSMPVIVGPAGPEGIGYSNRYPGGLAERMVLQEALLLPVPEALTAEVAALTEPLAVGEHAVQLARLTGQEACVVIGCGPIGLAVVAALKARGHGPVIAADFSAPRRRLAELLGADEVVDPAIASPYGRWEELGVPTRQADRAALEVLGGPVRDAVIFEAVGVPGILRTIIREAPPRTRVVVVGVCMDPDQIEPFFAVTKELEVRFSFGYRREEFAATLERLGRRELPVEALVTGVVGLDGVAEAFAALGGAAQGKVLVRP
ncbi:MAG: zinc-binding dehydrogenase [Chloroflexi bacterium]|nr:MAG: zinc-binding dehydrogenase [Chloroflexota bacterium]